MANPEHPPHRFSIVFSADDWAAIVQERERLQALSPKRYVPAARVIKNLVATLPLRKRG